MSKNLRELAIDASTRAHSPYSKAKVGSAIETSDGHFYQGCNIENSSYGGTVCAERVAIWKAVSEGHKKLKKVYVYTEAGWPPCGMCLQVMTEFATLDLEITCGDKNGKEMTKKLGEFLTSAFTPDHLK
ncbi:MAG: cytidine deaminase [Bacteriovoracaceae bacterium]